MYLGKNGAKMYLFSFFVMTLTEAGFEVNDDTSVLYEV
jgi:hypothetical protein